MAAKKTPLKPTASGADGFASGRYPSNVTKAAAPVKGSGATGRRSTPNLDRGAKP